MLLCIIIMLIGVLLLLLPANLVKRVCDQKVFLILVRIIGVIVIGLSVIFIYAVASGAIVLPLFKK